jgi:hypothetical protein
LRWRAGPGCLEVQPNEPGKLYQRNIYNQLNYGVGTVAPDPRSGRGTMLVSTHVLLNKSFAVMLTRERGVQPSGGPRIDCASVPAPAGGCFQNPVSGTAQWRRILGPQASPIVSIAFTQADGGLAFALDQEGALFELRPLDSDAPGARRISQIFEPGKDRFARQLVAAGADGYGLYALSDDELKMSTDRGLQWQRLASTAGLSAQRLQALAVDSARPQSVFLATESGVWLSLDGGRTWTDASGQLPRVPVMQLLMDAEHVYAVTFGRGLWAARLDR